MLSFQKVVINEPAGAGPDFPGQVMDMAQGDRSAAPESGSAQTNPSLAQGEALRVLDLTKSFRSGLLRRPIRGIEGISFTVPRGTLFALLGHNGAGKTTTINCILDLVHPTRGQVNILGRPHGDRLVRSKVGYLPERPYFFEHLTGTELLHFYAKLVGVPAKDRTRHVDGLVEKLAIGAYVGRRLKKYSKGMLQRIGIAQALLGDPELLILDEPMSGLDPMGRREVRELLFELKEKGKTIILSSHIVPDVEQVADTVAILRDGQLVQTSALSDLGGTPSFEISVEGGPTVAASNPASLREALDKLSADGRSVSNVQTHRTGLEDLYLAAHGRQEVVR
jgi:ABC-2 type transport system ATP-binding protein